MIADEAPRAGRREWLGLTVIALPCLLYAMDFTVLHLAVPHLSADLKPTSSQLLWIMDVYGFLLAGFLITMGTLGDRIGRRRHSSDLRRGRLDPPLRTGRAEHRGACQGEFLWRAWSLQAQHDYQAGPDPARLPSRTTQARIAAWHNSRRYGVTSTLHLE